MAELVARGVGEHRDALAVGGSQARIAVDVNLVECDAEGAQGTRHQLAKMAAGAPVEAQGPFSLYR